MLISSYDGAVASSNIKVCCVYCSQWIQHAFAFCLVLQILYFKHFWVGCSRALPYNISLTGWEFPCLSRKSLHAVMWPLKRRIKKDNGEWDFLDVLETVCVWLWSRPNMTLFLTETRYNLWECFLNNNIWHTLRTRSVSHYKLVDCISVLGTTGFSPLPYADQLWGPLSHPGAKTGGSVKIPSLLSGLNSGNGCSRPQRSSLSTSGLPYE